MTSSQQIAFYDDGVGTSSFKPFAILGGAFGFGLKRNVLDIYKFACRNYRSHLDYLALEAAAAKAENREERYGPWQSDDIFGFGFSRGAFTIRVVNGLICEQGLVSYQTEEELDRKVAIAYRAHRAEKFKSRFQVEWVFRKLRNLFVSAKHDKHERPVDHIAFLGLWDTVAAYGLPVDEMTRGVSRYLWPLELPDRQLDRRVRKACHALSLDDERTTFHPLLWDERLEKVATGTRKTSSERITQVWFAGVHSNVGGGYPDNSLAHVSLTWMLSEARSRGLTLKAAPGADPDAFTRVRSTQDKDGRIYDLRNGLSGYYRYGPRSVAALSDTKFTADKRDRVKIAIPKIHESVFDRISVDAHLYAPVALPPAYEILTYDERIVSPDDLTVRPNQPKYESSGAALHRERTQEHEVGSSIWRRRIIYFLTVIASIYLLTYPLTSTAPAAAEFTTPLRPLSDVIRMIGWVLPGAAARWTNAYAREPLWFLLCAGLVGLLLWLSASLKDRITDQMRLAWRVSLAKIDLNRGKSKRQDGRSAALIAVSVALALIALYPVPGWAGYALPKAPGSLQIFIERITHPYFQWFAFAILVTMWLPGGTIARFRLADAYRQFITSIKLKVAPAFFALAFLVGGFGFASHYLFNFRDSFGHFCQPVEKPVALEICDPDDMKLCKRASDGSIPSTCTSKACRGVPLRIRHRQPLHTGRRHARPARQLPVRPRAEWRMVVSRRAIRTGRNAAPEFSSAMERQHAGHGCSARALRPACGGLSSQANAGSPLWPRHRSLWRDRQRGELHRRRTTAGRPPGRNLQGHPQRTDVRLSEPAGQRRVSKPVSQRELGQGEGLGLSHPEVRAAVCAPKSQAQTTRPPIGGPSVGSSALPFEKIWSGRRGSNPRPRPWQGRALPLSYTRIRDGGDRSPSTAELCQMQKVIATVR